MSLPLPRFTDHAIPTDPLEIMLATREAEEAQAKADIAKGKTTDLADPADLRGIPCIAHGVGGTSPGTNPYTECGRNEHRLKRRIAA